MKLRYFFKIDHNKKPIPGSNIRRKSKPGNQWKEVKNICCSPAPDVPCTCDWRYFIQVDGRGNPIDYTLVKRKNRPNSDGMNWMEVIPDYCKIIKWDLSSQVSSTFSISINNIVVLQKTNVIGEFSGQIAFPANAVIGAILVNHDGGSPLNSLVAEKDGENIANDTALPSSSITFNADECTQYTISALAAGTSPG